MKTRPIDPSKCEGAYKLQDQILYLQNLTNYTAHALALSGADMRREYKMLKSMLKRAGFRVTRLWRMNAQFELRVLHELYIQRTPIDSHYLFDMLDRIYPPHLLQLRWSLSRFIQKLSLRQR